MRATFLQVSVSILLFGVGLLFLTCLGLVFPLQFVLTMATGWLTFLYRVAPRMEVDAGAIVLGCSAFGLFVLGLHVLLRYLFSSYNRRDVASLASTQDNWGLGPGGPDESVSAGPEHQPWRWRWTISVASIVLLMFIAGIAFVGVTHQAIWLATSPEPIIASNWTIRYQMESGQQLKQLAVGVQSYEGASMTLPPGMTIDAEGRQLHSWMTLILPMLEQRGVYDQIDLARAWDDPVQGKVFETKLKAYQSPYPHVRERTDAQGRVLAHYAGNLHVIGGTAVRTTRDISDGAANTILAGEAGGNYVPWGQPGNWRDPALGINQSPAGFGSPSQYGALFVFADGHVAMLPYKTSPEVLRALATPAGGEVTPED